MGTRARRASPSRRSCTWTPGAAHGIGNLFNAYKSHIPVVVLCAQQHSELLLQEPLLASDLVTGGGAVHEVGVGGCARPTNSGWCCSARSRRR